MDLGGNPSHNSEPSKGPLSPGKGGLEKDTVDLHGLSVPQASFEVRRVAHLLRSPSRAALAEAREILYTTQSRPLLSFIGDCLARELTPLHVDLALDLLRLKALPSTEEFLWALVSKEHSLAGRALPPVLGGREMAPLRVEIARLCVDPALFFSKEDRDLYEKTIQRLAFYAIVPLRRSADGEVVPTLVRAASRGGIEPVMNRRAMEALTYLEEAHPHHRVVTAREVAELVGTMDDLLRDPLNQMDVYSFVERWLRKPTAPDDGGLGIVREALHQQWRECISIGRDSPDERGISITDLVALLRYFDDPPSRQILQQACYHRDIGVSCLARLCVSEDAGWGLSALLEATRPSAGNEARLSALRVFGYSISEEIDRQVLPLFHHAVTDAFKEIGPEDDAVTLGDARSVLISVMARRLYTHPLDAPFTSGVLAQAMGRNVGETSLLATTLMSISRYGRVMSLSFYDKPDLITPVGVTVELLRLQSSRGDHLLSEVADTIEDHFILDSPARFGFQLARVGDKR